MPEEKAPDTATATVAESGTASQMDKRGRLIAVKPLNALDYYRVSKALGAVAAGNPATLDLAMIACAVRKIDIMPVALPTTEREIEFLIQQLDFDGLEAAGTALALVNRGAEKEAADSKN